MSKELEVIQSLTEHLNEDPFTDCLPKDYLVVDAGDWFDSHKSESRTDIVQHVESGLYFMVNLSRTGDYWQGYETELDGVMQVEPYQKTITAYRKVTNADAS